MPSTRIDISPGAPTIAGTAQGQAPMDAAIRDLEQLQGSLRESLAALGDRLGGYMALEPPSSEAEGSKDASESSVQVERLHSLANRVREDWVTLQRFMERLEI